VLSICSRYRLRETAMGACPVERFPTARHKVGLPALALVAALSACAPAQGAGAENRVETVATGAAVGCLLGGVLGALAGDFGIGLIGCAAGGALGAGAGYGVARGNERAALTEQQLVQRAEAAREAARAYEAQARDTAREIAALQREVDRIDPAYRRGRIDENQRKMALAEPASRIAELVRRTNAAQAASRRYEADAILGHRNGWNTEDLDRAVRDMTVVNRRERLALDDLQRALTVGRG